MTELEKQRRLKVATAFGLVYVLWGGTYLAMRVAVEHIPPYVMGAVRYLIAGPLMLGYLALVGKKIRISRQDALRLLVIGFLLLSVGNMGVAWAEEYVPSGLAALIAAVVPIWVAIIEVWIFKARRMSPLGLVGLALGIVGMLILLWPKLASGTRLGHPELIGFGMLMVASLSWAMGSVLSGRWSLNVDVFSASAWQMTLGGLINFLIALLSGGFHHTLWTQRGTLAILYLVTCGSWIGFTAYIWLLEHVPTPKVATYAYVNPLVAVYLGWLLLHEKVDFYMLAGTVVILAAVAMVNISKLKALRSSADTKKRESKLIGVAGD
jgi:drug/metabolite transporter (DMT)-like permease